MGQTYESVGCQLSLCAHLTTLLGKETYWVDWAKLTGTLSLESWKNTFHGIQLFEYIPKSGKFVTPLVHWSDLSISQPNAEVPWSHRKPPDDWTATRWYALVHRPQDTKEGSQDMAKAILIVQSQFWWKDSDGKIQTKFTCLPARPHRW